MPYNIGYQYWTGVFLMLRCILFLVFASNALQNSSTTLMSVTTAVLVVTFVTRALTGRIYKSMYVDILEALFLLNLGILSVATSHVMLTGSNQQTVADISVGISFVLFLGIITYHMLNQLMRTHLYKVSYEKLQSKIQLMTNRDHSDNEQRLLSPVTNTSTDTEELAPVTTYISIPSK